MKNATIDQKDLLSLEQVYLKTLDEYENDTFACEKSHRLNKLLNVREKINDLSMTLLKEGYFYLPYLLIPY